MGRLYNKKDQVQRYNSVKPAILEREAQRQRDLKQLLINVQNGAQLNPVIWAIEQMYGNNKAEKTSSRDR